MNRRRENGTNIIRKENSKSVSAKKESKLVPGILITITVLFLSLFLLLPLITIFLKAFERGMDVYIAAITDQEAFSAIRLTLLVALIVVPLNTIFGVAAAWLITSFSLKENKYYSLLLNCRLLCHQLSQD